MMIHTYFHIWTALFLGTQIAWQQVLQVGVDVDSCLKMGLFTSKEMISKNMTQLGIQG